MGNIIYFGDDDFKMSNGLTDVFVDYMLISGSQLAKKDSEKRLVAYLGECDQNYTGLGVVGFNIIKMTKDDINEKSLEDWLHGRGIWCGCKLCGDGRKDKYI